MTRTTSFSLITLCLQLACEDAELHTGTPEEDPAIDAQDEAMQPHRLTESQESLEHLMERPVQQLMCSTGAWSGEHAASQVVRFDLQRWANGDVVLDLEEGFAHADVAATMGLEPTIRRYTDARVSWEDTFIDAEFGDDGLWIYKHWSGVDGLWEGYLYDLEFTGGDILNCGGFVVHCWEPDIEAPFQYDPDTGLCTDDDGETGLNPWSLPMVRETGDGQCADLRWTELNEYEYSHAQLADWDLRGADLENAGIFFSDLVDAQLEGANLESLDFGYAHISGTTDAHTRLPESDCDRSEDRLSCVR